MNEYYFLHIPVSWMKIRDKLLFVLSDMAEDLLSDCKAGCVGENREYLSCWLMFQVAAADYELSVDENGIRHVSKKANTLMHFIASKLKIKYDINNTDFSEEDFNSKTEYKDFA